MQQLLASSFRPGVLIERVSPARFPVWKTIKLGTHETAAALTKAIAASGCLAVRSALDLIAQPTFPLASTETEINLASVLVSELGFSSGTPCGWIYERARQLGLRLCAPEVGPQLLLQQRGELDDLVLWIAMKPIIGSGGRRGAFAVTDGQNGSRWLVWYSGNPRAVCPPNFRFLFVLPRQHVPRPPWARRGAALRSSPLD
jgi:hypothetical protein